jgi:CheY-like chemotaxis protein
VIRAAVGGKKKCSLTCSSHWSSSKGRLLDIGLPGLDGYEVARQMRQIDGLEDMGLIALTGHGQADDLERARVAGFDRHFVKP